MKRRGTIASYSMNAAKSGTEVVSLVPCCILKSINKIETRLLYVDNKTNSTKNNVSNLTLSSITITTLEKELLKLFRMKLERFDGRNR